LTLRPLLERLRAGDKRAVARLISWVEDGDRTQLREAAEALNPATGRAQVVGLTGSPGVGKSTLADALVATYRGQGQTVGVLAVDPSSPFTGGALLGDRVRMQRHALDDGVYIRSMATRGHLGGLAWATPQAVRVLDAAGCDVVLVETVGVGQAEVEVAGLADTTVVALAPGFGDAVQVAKAGILEVADVFVVNKADRDGAEVVARDLRQMLHLGEARPWQVPVVMTVAERGGGIDQLAQAIAAHRGQLESSGELEHRRARIHI
jgi:LAO/AO transport system kinase